MKSGNGKAPPASILLFVTKQLTALWSQTLPARTVTSLLKMANIYMNKMIHHIKTWKQHTKYIYTCICAYCLLTHHYTPLSRAWVSLLYFPISRQGKFLSLVKLIIIRIIISFSNPKQLSIHYFFSSHLDKVWVKKVTKICRWAYD